MQRACFQYAAPRSNQISTSEFDDDDDRHHAFSHHRRRPSAMSLTTFAMRQGFLHVNSVPYALYIPVLARFMATFGSPHGRAAELLRQWIWRGAVLGVAPQGNTVGIRQGAAAIHTDPVASAQRLLELLPAPSPWRPDPPRPALTGRRRRSTFLACWPRIHDGCPRTPAMWESLSTLPGCSKPAARCCRSWTTRARWAEGWPTGSSKHPTRSTTSNRCFWSGNWTIGCWPATCLDNAPWRSWPPVAPSPSWSNVRQSSRKRSTTMSRVHALFGFRDGPDVTTLFDEDDEID